jgi:hypothetical protein
MSIKDSFYLGLMRFGDKLTPTQKAVADELHRRTLAAKKEIFSSNTLREYGLDRKLDKRGRLGVSLWLCSGWDSPFMSAILGATRQKLMVTKSELGDGLNRELQISSRWPFSLCQSVLARQTPPLPLVRPKTRF